MSDTIYPSLQWPTPCDFGPFLGGLCGKIVNLEFSQAIGEIQTANLEVELFETATANIILADMVQSTLPIDWTKTTFECLPDNGTYTFNQETQTLQYKPTETPSADRIVIINYTVFDSSNISATGTITVNVIDKTPSLTVSNVTLSGTEGQIYTINVASFTNAQNTTVNYTQSDSVTISTQPSEGTISISNGIITYTPSQVGSTNRTVTFKFIVKDLTGLTSEGTVIVTLSDITPALTTTNFTKSLVDNTTLTGSILSNITLKNDTFKTLSFNTPSEGTITVSGNNYTFNPGNTLQSNRTITVPYTVTTTSGLTSTSTLTINITYFNKFANTFWYGNLTKSSITAEDLMEPLSSKIATNYIGTYSIPSGTGVYKYFIYPRLWGENPTIVDASNQMPIATDNNVYLTVMGIELVIIRTYYQVNGAINIKFS